MKYKLLKDLYDCFCTPPELQAQKQEIDECHQALSKVLGKLERRLVLQIIDAKDRIAEDTSIDSFISGFELAWKLFMELNYYEDERSVSCRTAMELRARFAIRYNKGPVDKSKKTAETHRGSGRTVNWGIAKDGIYHPLEV